MLRKLLLPREFLWISTSALKSPFLGFLYLEFPQRKKIVMATNNSGLNSTSFTVKSDLKEGREQELTGHAEASEEDSCGKFMQHLYTCLRISEARVISPPKEAKNSRSKFPHGQNSTVESHCKGLTFILAP